MHRYFCGCFAYTRLRTATDDIPAFNLENIQTWGKVVNVYDGDTFRACIQGPRDYTIRKFTFRTLGYDAPEMKPLKTTPNREKHKEDAKLARDYLIRLFEYYNNFLWFECSKFDKYGRVLVVIKPSKNSKITINQLMLDSNLVLPYDGKTKMQFIY